MYLLSCPTNPPHFILTYFFFSDIFTTLTIAKLGSPFVLWKDCILFISMLIFFLKTWSGDNLDIAEVPERFKPHLGRMMIHRSATGTRRSRSRKLNCSHSKQECATARQKIYQFDKQKKRKAN